MGSVFIFVLSTYDTTEDTAEFMFLLGLSYISHTLISLAISYFFQKFMVRVLYRFIRLFYKSFSFFIQSNRKDAGFSILKKMLWLTLLPLPISSFVLKQLETFVYLETIIPYTVVLSIFCFFPSVFIMFTYWGMSSCALIGTTTQNILRISKTIRMILLGFTATNWIAFFSLIILEASDIVDAIMMIGVSLFPLIFLVPAAALCTFFYKKFLQHRSGINLIQYLKGKEKLRERKLSIEVM
jgi:hypothetical protein